MDALLSQSNPNLEELMQNIQPSNNQLCIGHLSLLHLNTHKRGIVTICRLTFSPLLWTSVSSLIGTFGGRVKASNAIGMKVICDETNQYRLNSTQLFAR